MIVDDSPVMRAFVKRTIQIAGLEMESCVEAGNGREALEKLAAEPVDLILTDINMPVLDGEGLLEALKRSPQWGHIPVVVVSTDSTEQRVGDLLRLGARDYVRKPFPPEKLSGVLCGIFPDWLSDGAGDEGGQSW
jgi:two-component system chemotaxis response regulator CheY